MDCKYRIMKANEAPEKIFLFENPIDGEPDYRWLSKRSSEDDIEYTRTDAFIKNVINFLNYKLDDVVATRVSSTIIPHHVTKQELIEDLKKYMKGE